MMHGPGVAADIRAPEPAAGHVRIAPSHGVKMSGGNVKKKKQRNKLASMGWEQFSRKRYDWFGMILDMVRPTLVDDGKRYIWHKMADKVAAVERDPHFNQTFLSFEVNLEPTGAYEAQKPYGC